MTTNRTCTTAEKQVAMARNLAIVLASYDESALGFFQCRVAVQRRGEAVAA